MKKADIIIFGGQSNMQGQTECLSENEVVANAFEYRYCSDTLKPLQNPVGEDIRPDFTEGYAYEKTMRDGRWHRDNITGSSCYGFTNMVPSFCRAYTKETGNTAIAVHAAKGSTVIAQWMPGTLGYNIIVKKTLAAIEKAKEEFEIGHIYLAWLQGESDAIYCSTKAYYKEAITILKNSLKKDLGLEKFGIVRVGHFARDERDDEIINAQEEVCVEDNDFVMLTRLTAELEQTTEYMNPEARGHYNAKGQEKLGNEAGTALAKLAK